jgi:hypothetical protein
MVIPNTKLLDSSYVLPLAEFEGRVSVLQFFRDALDFLDVAVGNLHGAAPAMLARRPLQGNLMRVRSGYFNDHDSAKASRVWTAGTYRAPGADLTIADPGLTMLLGCATASLITHGNGRQRPRERVSAC